MYPGTDKSLQSIMPLQFLVRHILRPWPPSSNIGDSTSALHPLHAIVKPLLLSPRSAADKYHTRIARVLSGEHCTGDAEEKLMWFVLKHEKPIDDSAMTEDQSRDMHTRKCTLPLSSEQIEPL